MILKTFCPGNLLARNAIVFFVECFEVGPLSVAKDNILPGVVYLCAGAPLSELQFINC